MCFPGVEIAAALGSSLLQGMGALADARYRAAAAKQDGRDAKLAAQRKAQQLDRQGTQELGALRAALAGSGNLSQLDFLSDGASRVGEEIAWAKYGGALAKTQAQADAARARQLGLRSVLGAGTQLLSGLNVKPSLEQRYPVIGTVRSFAPSAFRHYGL